MIWPDAGGLSKSDKSTMTVAVRQQETHQSHWPGSLVLHAWSSPGGSLRVSHAAAQEAGPGGIAWDGLRPMAGLEAETMFSSGLWLPSPSRTWVGPWSLACVSISPSGGLVSSSPPTSHTCSEPSGFLVGENVPIAQSL